MNSKTVETALQPNDEGGVALSPLVRQEGFAIVEVRCGVLVTHGFALTEWEAERRKAKMLHGVSPEFYGPIHTLPAVLNYSLPND